MLLDPTLTKLNKNVIHVTKLVKLVTEVNTIIVKPVQKEETSIKENAENPAQMDITVLTESAGLVTILVTNVTEEAKANVPVVQVEDSYISDNA